MSPHHGPLAGLNRTDLAGLALCPLAGASFVAEELWRQPLLLADDPVFTIFVAACAGVAISAAAVAIWFSFRLLRSGRAAAIRSRDAVDRISH